MQKALARLNWRWAASALLCLALIPNIETNAYAAAKPSHQKLTYAVYAGGIYALNAALDIKVTSDNRYSLVLDAKTRGLLGKLAPWEGTFETYGWTLGNGEFQPEQHKSTGIWRDETEIKDYAYAKNGDFKSLTMHEPGKEPYKKDVEADITKGTTDALSATLEVLYNTAQGEKCEGSSLVFDGKRSFDQIFKHEGGVILNQSKYNIYEGDAVECIVEVIPQKGKWYEKPRGWMSIQEQGRAKGTMPTVWLAKIDENAPAIPVKIRVKTDYGTLFMHLSEYESGDIRLQAEERGKNEDDLKSE